MPFYGYNRPGAKISEGVRESFWLQGMMAGFPASYFCIKAFSERRMSGNAFATNTAFPTTSAAVVATKKLPNLTK